ncbi:MAG: hypothetical protein K4571_07045 [Deltaproteobacteria bacterium]
MKKAIICLIVFTFLTIVNASWISLAVADDQDLFTQGSSYAPNILIVLDNSQSMDEDFMGNAVNPYASESKLVAAKKQLQAIVNKYAGQMRIGLMTYKLPTVSSYYVHNSPYFVSHEPKSYCPSADETVLAACQAYCVDPTNTTAKATCENTATTGCKALNASFDASYFADEIITGSTGAKREKYCNLTYPKTNRMVNPSMTSIYVYYKQALPYYQSSEASTHFRWAHTYGIGESTGAGVVVPGVQYTKYLAKQSTSDDFDGYTLKDGNAFQTAPSDSDVALGYLNFGKRRFVTSVGHTWFASGSTGVGYLQVPADTNPANNTHLNAILAKLATHEDDWASYMSNLCSGTKANSCAHIVNAGLTPIAGTLQSAIDYFKGNYTGESSPIQDSCQKNFVIFVTDGLPSVNESGTSGSAAALMPTVLAKVDALRALTKIFKVGGVDTPYSFNILTYVVGVAMTPTAKTHLDTMASHGGTAIGGKALYADNETQIYTALDTILSDVLTRSYAFATSSISSSRTADENFIYEATFEPVGNNYPFWKGFLKKWSLKTDGSLNAVVWEAGTQFPVPASRTMQTLLGGSLTKFQAYDIDPSDYVPYTKMNVADQAAANKIIKYVRGYATDPNNTSIVTNPDNWKLGDVFHSSPITLGTPTPFFNDALETNPTITNKKAFEVYRDAHPRASTCPGGVTTCAGWGKRMIVVGANDGQFHAFNATSGTEFWSFIPPNLLPKLQYLAHDTTSSTLGHHFFVDGRITATDAWLPTTVSNGTNKDADDWRTLVMVSLGRNDRDYTTADKSAVPETTKLWSSAVSCDSGLTEYYDSTLAPYYCGYYAFDFTNAPTTLPAFKWTLQPDSSAAPFLGEPWSAVSIGRVKIGGMERWIGVIGGGYNAATCGTSACADKRGKGIIVFDLRTGQSLWSYTWNVTDAPNVGSPYMGDAIPSQVSLVDGDYDGYLDHGYVGDMKGNMWQIKFCSKADLIANASCSTSSWQGSLLLDKLSGSDKYPIYTQPTVTRDSSNNTWIFWSSGDVVDPTGSGPAAFVYGMKPLLCKDVSGNPTPCLRSSLVNITSDKSTYCGETTKTGWYINLSGKNEQVLSQPVAFNNILYFTSFIPASGSSLNCTKTGTAQLYAISIETSPSYCNVGAGLFTGGDRFITVGAGIASGVLLSYNPDGTMNAYVTVSGAGGQEGGTIKAPFEPPTIATRANMLFWKDLRIQ